MMRNSRFEDQWLRVAFNSAYSSQVLLALDVHSEAEGYSL
jgi:hypothetical protein